MGKKEHLEILKKGVTEWNRWRRKNPNEYPDFSDESLYGILSTKPIRVKGHRTDLSGINLSNARLRDSFLEYVILNNADLSNADLDAANLTDAQLVGANLENANLHDANLRRANLKSANLHNANLMYAQLVGTNLEDASLKNCNIYGIAVWKIQLSKNTDQSSLYINNYGEATIRVPSLEIAQLIYLLHDHKKIRDVLRAVGEKAILILGSFEPERKKILDAVADELVKMQYLPIIFDFEQIPGKNLTETIMTLAGMSRFVIGDLTKPKSIPQEAQAIIPNFKIPFVPIIKRGKKRWSMFDDMLVYDWVIQPTRTYSSQLDLIDNLKEIVVQAEKKYEELSIRKSQ
jgi:hypothetical protein